MRRIFPANTYLSLRRKYCRGSRVVIALLFFAKLLPRCARAAAGSTSTLTVTFWRPIWRALPLALLVSCFAGNTGTDAGSSAPGAIGTSSDGSDNGGTLIPTVAQGATFGSTDTGTKTLQRLDIVEFDNTVHDLLGTQQTLAADDFPADNLYGVFDNVGSSLGVSLSLLQAWTDAATSLGEEVTASAADASQRTQIYLKVAPCATDSNLQAAACLSQTVSSLGLAAWRRPLTNDEVTSLTAVASAAGSDLPTQVGALVATLLTSANFMFRVEVDPNPASTVSHGLNAYELASRLSYFVWRSCPDEALLAAAKNGSLSTDAGLKVQLTRMLADSRANSLVTGFGQSWVGLNRFDEVTPSATIFPHFNATVRQSMRQETQNFLADFLLRGQPVNQLFTANYTYLDATLASYYGVAGPSGTTQVKTTLPASSGRLGLLSQGSILVVGSTGASTSAVRRGENILTQLLCVQLGSPPNNVANLSANSNVPMTQRQSLEIHASTAACSGCHVDMDALGFAFEGFSGSGEKRSLDNNLPIDTTGVFDSNSKFASNVDLAPALAADARFTNCVTQMLFVYALGRPATDNDAETLFGLHESLLAGNLNLTTLMEQIVLSQAFRSRHG